MIYIYKLLRFLKFYNLFYFKALIYIKQKYSTPVFCVGRNGIVLNCGGPRSGSTLLNMIIDAVLLIGLQSKNNYVDNPEELSKRLSSYSHFSLVKTHRYFSNIQKLVNRGQVIAFMTHRDIRDVTVSLYQKGWVEHIDDFIESKDLKQIAYTSVAYAQVKGMNILSYKQLMDDPRSVIALVSRKLDIELTSDQIDRIADAVTKDNVSRRIGDIQISDEEDKELDCATGLHCDHIKDGKSGKWKDILSAEEARAIADECSEYLDFFDYSNE